MYDATHIVTTTDVHITKVEVWKIFHGFLSDDTFVYNIMPRIISHSSIRSTNIEIIWNKPCDTIVLRSLEETEYTLKVYPTEPFKAVFYACSLPVGVYTCDLFDGTFEITASVDSLGDAHLQEFEPPALFNPVPEERVQKAWAHCVTLLTHRGYRQATDEEVGSFVETHRRKYALSFCIDPLRKAEDRICWRSPEFIEKFGDTKWLQVEHDNYEECILAILRRTPPTEHFGLWTSSIIYLHITWVQYMHLKLPPMHYLLGLGFHFTWITLPTCWQIIVLTKWHRKYHSIRLRGGN